MSAAAQSANQSAKNVATSKPVKIGARIGLVAYGITHLLIAWLALQVAFGGALGGGGGQVNQTGAFQTLAQQPFGRVLLWVLVIGFVAVALWRLTQAIWGFGYVTDRARNIRKRATSGAKVVVFVAFAVAAGTTAAGSGSSGGGQQRATAGVLGLPAGQFLVGAVGIAILAVGIIKIVQGWRKKFRDDMDLPADHKARDLTVRLGQIGFIAKGASIGLIGVLVVVAAIRFRPDESSGLDGALKALAAQPFGIGLLIVVALGLAAYGVFCFFDARYHRV